MYGPSSSGVDDYTAERRKTERKKEKCMFSPLHHLRPTTERRNFFFREIKNETVLKYATMKFLIFHKFCSFWSSCVPTFLYGRLHREKKD